MTITESRRIELGQCRLQLRLTRAGLQMLDKLCKASGLSRSAQVEVMLAVRVELMMGNGRK